MKIFQTHVEAGDANLLAVEKSLLKYIEMISEYDARNVFEVHVHSLYYKLAPDGMNVKQSSLKQKTKECFALLVCTNTGQSEKFELIFIGTSCQLWVFCKNDGSHYDHDYYANKNAWMKTSLFYFWPRRFDVSFNGSGRKVLSLRANVSAHRFHDILLDLQKDESFQLTPEWHL